MSRVVPLVENSRYHAGTVRQDARYFRKNPRAVKRIRKATHEERRDFGLLPGTQVVVVKLSADRHARMIHGLPGERNN